MLICCVWSWNRKSFALKLHIVKLKLRYCLPKLQLRQKFSRFRWFVSSQTGVSLFLAVSWHDLIVFYTLHGQVCRAWNAQLAADVGAGAKVWGIFLFLWLLRCYGCRNLRPGFRSHFKIRESALTQLRISSTISRHPWRNALAWILVRAELSIELFELSIFGAGALFYDVYQVCSS